MTRLPGCKIAIIRELHYGTPWRDFDTWNKLCTYGKAQRIEIYATKLQDTVRVKYATTECIYLQLHRLLFIRNKIFVLLRTPTFYDIIKKHIISQRRFHKTAVTTIIIEFHNLRKFKVDRNVSRNRDKIISRVCKRETLSTSAKICMYTGNEW